ncbi:hypothetical protein AOLI_G00099890 [Acnodon oligacanthus]
MSDQSTPASSARQPKPLLYLTHPADLNPLAERLQVGGGAAAAWAKQSSVVDPEAQELVERSGDRSYHGELATWISPPEPTRAAPSPALQPLPASPLLDTSSRSTRVCATVLGVHASSRGGVTRSTWPSTRTQLRLPGVAGKEARVLEAPTFLPPLSAHALRFSPVAQIRRGFVDFGGLIALKFVCLTESV